MKRISIVCLASLLFISACHNSGSSTVGTYEQEETSNSTENSESTHGEHGTEKAAHGTVDTLKAPADTNVGETGVSTDTSNINAGQQH